MIIHPAYLDFIKYTICEENVTPESTVSIDWNGFLMFCKSQGIIGLIFDGLQRADIRIDTSILIKWIGLQHQIIKKNAITNNRMKETVGFFEKRGLRSCILKGQVNALMYPKPELRCPRDIDIWVEGKREDIIKMVLNVRPEAHYSIHHIKFPLFKDVSVEVHYRPIYLSSWFKDKKLQGYIREIEESQFAHQIKFGEVEIGSLTDAFNVVYQMLHMYHHFFETKNNFKQFIDYLYLLKQVDIKALRDEAKGRFEQFGVAKYASGIMWILKDVLGLDSSRLLMEPNEKEGKLILKESFYFGTFSSNNFCYIIEQAIANFRIISHYPKEVLMSPLFLLWHQWWKLKIYISLNI